LPEVECLPLDLNGPFSAGLGGRRFKNDTPLEGIEHLENPRAFLRGIRSLLDTDGLIFIPTPNIQNGPPPLAFLPSRRLRLFGRDPALNDPTHISPIHSLMMERMLKDTGLVMMQHAFDTNRPKVTRPLFRLICSVLNPLLPGLKGGDCHFFVIR